MAVRKPSIIVLLVIATSATTGCGPLFGNRNDGEWTVYSSSDPNSIESPRLLRDWKRRRLGEEMREQAATRPDDTPAAKSPAAQANTETQATTETQQFVDVLNRLEEAGGLTKAQRDRLWAEIVATKPQLRKTFLQSLTATLNYRLQKLEKSDVASDAASDAAKPAKVVRSPKPQRAVSQPAPAAESGTLGHVFSPALPAQPHAVRRDPPTASQPPWTARADTTDSSPPLEERRPPQRSFEPAANLSFVRPRKKTAAWENRTRCTIQRTQVERAAYHAPAHDDRDAPALRDDHRSYRWQDHVLAAADKLERERRSAQGEPFDAALETRLRMLYLAVGYKEEALVDLPRNRAMSSGERLAHQDFLQSVVGGIDEYMQHARDEFEPAEANLAKVTRKLRQAADHLGKVATLEVNNVTLCRKVTKFGDVEPFTAKTFRPGQMVMLYAEVENFVSERVQQSGQSPKYHTALKSSYRVFDSEGRVVGKGMAFRTVKDESHNYRHDFFIAYRIELPETLYPGTHTFKLTVDDVRGQKIGQGSVEFEVVAEEKTTVK